MIDDPGPPIARPARPRPWRRRLLLVVAVPVLLLLIAAGISALTVRIPESGSRQTLVFYAAPTDLRPGSRLDRSELEARLLAAGYTDGESTDRPGSFRRISDGLEIHLRPFRYPDRPFEGGRVRLEFRGARVERVESPDGVDPADCRLDPERIASFEGTHGAVLDYLPLDKAPPLLVDAILAVEDSRFRDHVGLDPIGIARALRVNLARGEAAQGASTLTQQLARSLFLENEKTLPRKVEEAILALGLELRYSKDEILEGYLNAVYWGHWGTFEIRGAREAARFYLGRELEKADPAQLALLAGLLRAPNLYSPYADAGRARARRDLVLSILRGKGILDPAAYEAALKQPLPRKSVPERPAEGSYFLEAARREMERRAPPGTLGREGISVFTTLDPREQAVAVESVRKGLEALERKHPGLRNGRDPLEGAAVVLDPATGCVTALVGGRGFRQSPFNRATEARRQPGSLFKPFVYLAALRDPRRKDGSFWTPATLIPDEPIEIPMGRRRAWAPQNYDREFRGPVTVRQALEQSLNVPTAFVAHEIGARRVAAAAEDLGIRSPLNEVPSLALGTSEVTLLEITAAYAALAAGGRARAPTLLRGCVDSDGREIRLESLEDPPGVEPPEAFLLTTLLEGVIASGTGRSALGDGVRPPVAGKTGTTDDYRDAWFVGFDPGRAAGVWVGFDRRRDVGLSGAAAALPIWSRIFRKVQGVAPAARFRRPEGVITEEICVRTGQRATERCPDTVVEALLAGTSPAATCAAHEGGFFDRIFRWIGGGDDDDDSRSGEGDRR